MRSSCLISISFPLSVVLVYSAKLIGIGFLDSIGELGDDNALEDRLSVIEYGSFYFLSGGFCWVFLSSYRSSCDIVIVFTGANIWFSLIPLFKSININHLFINNIYVNLFLAFELHYFPNSSFSDATLTISFGSFDGIIFNFLPLEDIRAVRAFGDACFQGIFHQFL